MRTTDKKDVTKNDTLGKINCLFILKLQRTNISKVPEEKKDKIITVIIQPCCVGYKVRPSVRPGSHQVDKDRISLISDVIKA